MFREFDYVTAWTDAMPSGSGFVGLIGYQPKCRYSRVTTLWVIDPRCACVDQAESAAEAMLRAICDIHPQYGVLYADGIYL
ncbi:MAG: hypothetical protein AAAB13_01840 [Pseudomonas sp.]